MNARMSIGVMVVVVAMGGCGPGETTSVDVGVDAASVDARVADAPSDDVSALDVDASSSDARVVDASIADTHIADASDHDAPSVDMSLDTIGSACTSDCDCPAWYVCGGRSHVCEGPVAGGTDPANPLNSCPTCVPDCDLSECGRGGCGHASVTACGSCPPYPWVCNVYSSSTPMADLCENRP